jgi:hypothetical protein
MDTETIYYKSPVGVLEIHSNQNAIAAVLFLNSWKGKKINEAEINFAVPESAAIKNILPVHEKHFQLPHYRMERHSGKRFGRSYAISLMEKQ